MKKFLSAILTLVMVTASVGGVSGADAKKQETFGPMTIHFIDVGQADAILVDYGEFEVLIDGGNKADGPDVAAYLKRFVDGALDLVVATHEHEDHIGGLPAVFAAFQVDKVIENGRAFGTKTYAEYAAAVNEEGCIRMTAKDMTIDMKGATFQVLKMAGTYKDVNDNSVITMVTYGDTKILLVGDAGRSVEQNNLDRFSDVDILKAGHHGSNTASGTEFLNKTRPETVIISAATGNRYRHPHLAALQRFQKAGAKLYGTLKSGTVIATLDGTGYTMNTNQLLTLADAGQ